MGVPCIQIFLYNVSESLTMTWHSIVLQKWQVYPIQLLLGLASVGISKLILYFESNTDIFDLFSLCRIKQSSEQ